MRNRLLVLPVITAAVGAVLPEQSTPRLPDGKTDFGGRGVWAPIWVLDWSDAKYVDKAMDVPFTSWGLATFQERPSSYLGFCSQSMQNPCRSTFIASLSEPSGVSGWDVRRHDGSPALQFTHDGHGIVAGCSMWVGMRNRPSLLTSSQKWHWLQWADTDVGPPCGE